MAKLELELGTGLLGIPVEVDEFVLGRMGCIIDLGVNRSRAMECDDAVVVKSGIVSVVVVVSSCPVRSLTVCNAVSMPNRIPDGRRRYGLSATFSISMLRLLWRLLLLSNRASTSRLSIPLPSQEGSTEMYTSLSDVPTDEPTLDGAGGIGIIIGGGGGAIGIGIGIGMGD